MTEPITTNRSLIVPNTGDLSGTWGTAALNPNFQTLDALFGGITTITLSSATTILLTVPATTGIWPGTLSQSVNSMIRFTGAQSASATIQFTLPGFYIIENKCTGTTSVRLQPWNTTGNCVGAIPGKKCHVFFDGTHMDYLNQSDPGTAYDLHTNTTTLPPWMTVCTIAPYLLKDGSTYNVATYPALAQYLGSTYGGDGATTFGVPDESNRMRIPYDTTSSHRVTNATSGINGASFGSAGGLQASTMTTGNLPPYTPAGTNAISGGTYAWNNNAGSVTAGGSTQGPATDINVRAIVATFTGTAQGGTSKTVPNMPPAIVDMLALIKT